MTKLLCIVLCFISTIGKSMWFQMISFVLLCDRHLFLYKKKKDNELKSQPSYLKPSFLNSHNQNEFDKECDKTTICRIVFKKEEKSHFFSFFFTIFVIIIDIAY